MFLCFLETIRILAYSLSIERIVGIVSSILRYPARKLLNAMRYLQNSERIPPYNNPEICWSLKSYLYASKLRRYCINVPCKSTSSCLQFGLSRISPGVLFSNMKNTMNERLDLVLKLVIPFNASKVLSFKTQAVFDFSNPGRSLRHDKDNWSPPLDQCLF